MMKVWFLRVHRWLALLFALPLAVIIFTGLILSFEPWLVTRAIEPGALTTQKLAGLLTQYDPAGQARAIAYRSYDHALTLGARGSGAVVDVVSGQLLPGPSALAGMLGTMRGLHERLQMNAGWLVITSTAAMLVIILLGILMGWPRFSNTLSGWHKAMAWGLLPLILLSPLSGILMASGITFVSPPAATSAPPAAPLKLADAIKIAGRDHDLSGLIWMRPQGGRLLMRIAEGGEFALYAVTPDGAVAQPRNWPRLWHEGNFAGAWSSAMNLVISLAMTGLLVTGVWIWLRRQFRRRTRRVREAVAA